MQTNLNFVQSHLIPAPPKLKDILPLILQPTKEQICLLDYSEKLQKTDFSLNKCCIFSTFHRIPSMPVVNEKNKPRVAIGHVHEDVTYLAAALDAGCKDGMWERYLKVSIFLLRKNLAVLTAAKCFSTGVDESILVQSANY